MQLRPSQYNPARKSRKIWAYRLAKYFFSTTTAPTANTSDAKKWVDSREKPLSSRRFRRQGAAADNDVSRDRPGKTIPNFIWYDKKSRTRR